MMIDVWIATLSKGAFLNDSFWRND